jgi:MFS family permease
MLAAMLPEPYMRLLRVQTVRQPLIGSVIGRLPIAALSLATVLMIRHATGSFAIAGAVEAAFAIAGAISLPVQGRLIDRLGQSRVLVVGAILNPIALVALVVAAQGGAAPLPLALLGALCGATVPALSSSMRTLWADLVPESDLISAYALDAVLFEVGFVVGPLVTALLVAVASPAVAVLANAVYTFTGALIYALSRASRSWRGRLSVSGWAGPLRSPGIVVLMLTELGFGVALGAMELSVTAFATQHGSSSLAGVLIAVQAAASMAGGLWYGIRHRSANAADRYPLLCFVIAVGFAPLLLATSILNAVPLMVLSGFAFAPATAVAYKLIEELAPQGTITEASTWLITAVVTGVAVGNGVAGPLINGGHAHRGFAVAVAAAALAWLASALGRGALRGAPATA